GRIGDRGFREDVFHGQRLAGQRRGAPAEARRQRDLGVELGPQRIADPQVHGAAEIAATVQQSVGGGKLLAMGRDMGRPHFVDQRGHRGIGLDQFGEHRQQAIAHIGDPAPGEVEVEHGEEFAVGAGIGDQRDAAGVVHRHGLRHRIVGVTAEDDVDAGDAAGKLEVDIHAVMRQQDHRIDLVVVAMAIDQLLQFLVADAESPVRREAFRMGDRYIGKRLADHGHAV
ncbi:hypothetical protein KXV85_001624, partial [Aspergillus fumigatus]